MSKRRSNNYDNPNGEMTIGEMILIKHHNKLDGFMRGFKVITNKCPNKKLRPKNGVCFHCIDCLIGAFDEIKEFKNYYKVNKEKYPKEEFNENK